MNENLQIDPSQLDEEWLQQPLLFDQAQQEAADCLKARDELKDSLIRLEADRSAYLRSNFKNEGFEKSPAQAVVDSWVTMQAEVEVCRKELVNANYALVRANNTVASFDMRKRALSKLTDLWISNYFSIPNPNRLVKEGKREIKVLDVEEKSVKAVSKLNEKKELRSKRGSTKEEVLDKIKNPDTKAEAKKRIEAEEHKTGNEEGETEAPVEKPRARRRRRS